LNDVDLAFLSSDRSSENTEVLVVNTANRESRVLTTFQGRADWLAVHPEGKSLAVVLKEPSHTQRIVLRNLSDQRDTTIHEGSEYENLRWSPDGSVLSWDRPGASINGPVTSAGIWMISIGKSEPQLVTSDGYCPVWRNDGRAIYFVSQQGQRGLWRYDLAKRTRQLIRQWDTVFNYDVVGQRLVFAQHKNNSQIYSISLHP
jgi:Tol biopolymer transport system component